MDVDMTEDIKKAQQLLSDAENLLWGCGEKMGSNKCGSVNDWLIEKYNKENEMKKATDMIKDLPDGSEFVNPANKVEATLKLYDAPCHCNYGSDCCGIFIEVVGGNLVCNECGMGIVELLEVQAGRKVS